MTLVSCEPSLQGIILSVPLLNVFFFFARQGFSVVFGGLNSDSPASARI